MIMNFMSVIIFQHPRGVPDPYRPGGVKKSKNKIFPPKSGSPA